MMTRLKPFFLVYAKILLNFFAPFFSLQLDIFPKNKTDPNTFLLSALHWL